MKITIALVLLNTTACVDPNAEPIAGKRLDVVLFAAPDDVADGKWALRPSDYLIDRALHVTGLASADGASRDFAATIEPGDALVIDDPGLASAAGWYDL